MNLVAITSGKGGTGKSCVAAYTGIALALSNKKTLLVEMGADVRSLDIITASQTRAVFDVADVLEGHCDPEKAIVEATLGEGNLSLLTAPLRPYCRPEPEAVRHMLRLFRQKYDYILIDGVDFSASPPDLFDAILMVTTPDLLSLRACQARARELYSAGAEAIRLVINNVPSLIQPISGVDDFDDIINQIGAQLIAVIPHSPKLHYSANNSAELDEESMTIQVFDNLAARLRGQSRPLLIR